MNHDVSVILRGKKDRDYFYEDIKVKEVRGLQFPPFNMGAFGKKVEKILPKGVFDLVHMHSLSMPVLKMGCPVMVTAHFCMKEAVPIFYHPIKDVNALYKNIFLPFYIRATKNILKACNKVTVVSDSHRQEYEKHYQVKADVIHNAVDAELFKEMELEKENAILFVGALHAGKGLLDLIHVADRLRKSHPNLKIYVIGEGPLKGYLQKEIKRKKLINVRIIRTIPHKELPYYYNVSKIFVQPSYYEGLPNTILEAMACGLPVIATKVGGIPEQITEGVTGYMVPPGDTRGFYERISELLEDGEKRIKFGRKGREKIIERFTWPLVAKRVVNIYQELLDAHREEES